MCMHFYMVYIDNVDCLFVKCRDLNCENVLLDDSGRESDNRMLFQSMHAQLCN